jgi:hypothetical protein
LAFPVPTAPIAPAPFVPDGSTPVKLSTVMDEATLCDNVAVTVTPLNADGANARQISAVPNCTLVRWTSTHVRPPPVTLVTVVLGDVALSVEINARSSSFPDAVEKTGVLTVLAAAL